MKWFPERMTEVEIEVPESSAKKVTEMLANVGLLQIKDVSYLSTDVDESLKVDWQAKANAFSALEKRVADTLQSLQVGLGYPPTNFIRMVSDAEQLRPFAEQIEHEVQKSSELLADIQKKTGQLKQNINLLQPLSGLNIPIDRIRNRRYVYSIFGTMPIEKIDRFKTSMANIPFVLLELKKEAEQAIVLLMGTRQNKDYLRRAARSAYLKGIDLPDTYEGTPEEIIVSLENEIADLNRNAERISLELEKILKLRAERLQDLYWRVRYSRMMCEAFTHYGRLKHAYLIAGWLPADKMAELSDQLQEISPKIILDIKDTSSEIDSRNTPIIVEKQGFQLGFQKLVNTYGLPAYNEINPTVLLTLTFPLIFGAMFGDVGHGLVLAIAGIILMLKKIKKLNRLASLGSVILLCGISAIIFGFLFGSVFGFEELLPAIWQHPMDNIMSLLLITGAGGAVLLTIANILALINDFHQRHWIHFFFNSKGLAGLLMYWSLLGLVLSLVIPKFPIPTGIFILTITISVIMIFLSGFLERLIEKHKPYFEGGVFVYFIQSFFELFETLIGYLSNSLSYVRIGAFAVAHAGLTSVFFILAELVSPDRGFGYWAVIVFGNLFVIGFEGMIVSIQTLRLEYYEFFSKFFSSGGRKFAPFRLSETNSEGAK